MEKVDYLINSVWIVGFGKILKWIFILYFLLKYNFNGLVMWDRNRDKEKERAKERERFRRNN